MIWLFLLGRISPGSGTAARSIHTILDVDIRPLAVHTIGIFRDLHAFVRVDHRADRLGHPS